MEKTEKKKRGRKPTANPKSNRLMFRLNSEDNKRFLEMYKCSGKPSYSAFIADCVLNKFLKIIEINKSAIDFVILLSSFFAQFRATGVNYNQVIRTLKTNFQEKTALALLYKLEKTTIELVVTNQKIIDITASLRKEFFK